MVEQFMWEKCWEQLVHLRIWWGQTESSNVRHQHEMQVRTWRHWQKGSGYQCKPSQNSVRRSPKYIVWRMRSLVLMSLTMDLGEGWGETVEWTPTCFIQIASLIICLHNNDGPKQNLIWITSCFNNPFNINLITVHTL